MTVFEHYIVMAIRGEDVDVCMLTIKLVIIIAAL